MVNHIKSIDSERQKHSGAYKLHQMITIDGEDGIKDQDYSLNPGRYVGVVIEDDGLTAEEFKAQMMELVANITLPSL